MGALSVLEQFLKFFVHMVDFYEHFKIWLILCYLNKDLPMAWALYIEKVQNERKNSADDVHF